MNDRIKYYLENINNMLSSDPGYERLVKCIEDGKNEFRVVQKRSLKTIDLTWVKLIEDVLPNLDTIIRNPRRFIVTEEDIIDVSLARSVSKESVKHLATHTGLISAVEGDRIIPSKILNVSKEESIEIYENRFIYTLIRKLGEFVQVRYEAVKNAIINEDKAQISVESLYKVGGMQLLFKLDTIANMTFEDSINLNKDDLSDYERVARIQSIVNGFRNSAFARDMKKCTPVRPPITQTNVLKNDVNFKAALKLWDLIYNYDKEGYDVEYIDEATPLNKELSDDYKGIMYLNHLIVRNLLSNKEVKETLGYTNLKIDQSLPFEPKKLKDTLCVIRLELFLLRVQKELSELVENETSIIRSSFDGFEKVKNIDTVKVLKGYVIRNKFKRLDNKYVTELIKILKSLKPMEYEGYSLGDIKTHYVERLREKLTRSHKDLNDQVFN